MKIGLHDSEKDSLRQKTFPNYALMKIAAYHKSIGDKVEWFRATEKYDRVYSSKVFDFTPENKLLPPDTIKGGTGYDVHSTLSPEIEAMFPDYSIYPECDYAIGYITRGCPNKCRWCVVPEKEGNIKPYRTWQELVRPDSKKLVLMDNNILACEYGIQQLESLIDSGYAIDLNQGMDARLVTDRIAHILSRLKWIRHIRFSCDTTAQIQAIEDAAELARDYDLAKMRMGKVFKTLSDKGIVEQTNTNSYVLTEDCVANAQEFYFSEIREAIAELKNLAEVANIAPDLLIDVLKGEITA